MHNGSLKKDKGFTIIEVVLVLAIAGLIFLIVFLALPQLQRSRRDTQRKNDTGRMLAALESRAGNTNGDYPVNAPELATFVSTYLTDEFRDPSSGNDYSVAYALGNSGWASSAALGSVAYRNNAECDNEFAVGLTNQTRTVAVVMKLEQATFCQDNK